MSGVVDKMESERCALPYLVILLLKSAASFDGRKLADIAV